MNRNTLSTDIHTNKILLSIIVPIYNTGKYIGKCLESLTAQNLSLEKYEIICINDGSTDNSCVIVESYAKKFSNIRFVSQENKGVSAARNKGIHLAKGKYIWFVDSDDFIKSNVLGKIAEQLMDSDCDRLTVLPFSFQNDEDNVDPNEITADRHSVVHKNWLWTQIIRRKLIIGNHICFDEDMSFVEDAVFMNQLYPLFVKTIAINEVVYFYRKRNDSLVSQNQSRKIKNRIRAAEICDEIIIGKRFGDSQIAIEFKYICVTRIMRNTVSLKKSDRIRLINELKNKNLFPLKLNLRCTPKSRKKYKDIKSRIIRTFADYSYTRIGYGGFVFCNYLNSLMK